MECIFKVSELAEETLSPTAHPNVAVVKSHPTQEAIKII